MSLCTQSSPPVVSQQRTMMQCREMKGRDQWGKAEDDKWKTVVISATQQQMKIVLVFGPLNDFIQKPNAKPASPCHNGFWQFSKTQLWIGLFLKKYSCDLNSLRRPLDPQKANQAFSKKLIYLIQTHLEDRWLQKKPTKPNGPKFPLLSLHSASGTNPRPKQNASSLSNPCNNNNTGKSSCPPPLPWPRFHVESPALMPTTAKGPRVAQKGPDSARFWSITNSGLVSEESLSFSIHGEPKAMPRPKGEAGLPTQDHPQPETTLTIPAPGSKQNFKKQWRTPFS